MKIVFFALSLAAIVQSAASEPKEGNLKASPEIALTEVKPKLVKVVDPIYPYNQALAGVTGSVTLEFVIDLEGRVTNPYVVGSNNPAFERPALDAIMKWKFSPGIRDGHPVYVRASQKVEFLLDQGGREGFWRITKGANHSSLPPELKWDEAPVPINTTFPVYPLSDLRRALKGKTKLSFVVGPEGRVVKAKLIQATTPEMGLAALATIETWQFTPAKRKDGTPVLAALSIEHTFDPSGFGDVPVTYAAHRILRMIEKQPGKIVAASELSEQPKPISRRPPVYSTTLHEDGQQAEAVIDFFIDEEGDAQLPSIISSSTPEFGYASVQAVAAWRFEPARKNGKPVVIHARVPLNFQPSSPSPSHP